jgi:hypothetical protein
MNFREWLNLIENAGSPAAKQGLYPPAYSAVALYPPCDIMTWAADAITYMPPERAKRKFIWGKGILAKPLELVEPKDVSF